VSVCRGGKRGRKILGASELIAQVLAERCILHQNVAHRCLRATALATGRVATTGAPYDGAGAQEQVPQSVWTPELRIQRTSEVGKIADKQHDD